METLEDIYIGSIETDRGTREQVRFYDTRGLRDGMEFPRHYYTFADGFVLVYSIDSKESFKRMEALKKDIDRQRDKKEVRTEYIYSVYVWRLIWGNLYTVCCCFLHRCWGNLLIPIPQVTIVVLGNKLDKQDERRVDANLAQNWAKNEKVRLWEVSVVDRRTLIEPFVYLASKMTQPQSKSTFPLSRNKNKGSGSTDSWVNRHCIYVQEGRKREKRCVEGSLVLLMINFDTKDRRMLRSDNERKGRMIVWIFIYSENCSYWHLYLMFWWNTTFLINE